MFKAYLILTPVLAIPKSHVHYNLDTDDCGKQIIYVSLQKQDHGTPGPSTHLLLNADS